MKHLISVFFLLCSAFCLAAPVPTDYNLNVHVSSTRMVRHGNSAYYQDLTVIIDSKKYELESLSEPNVLLMLGDYKARIVEDRHGAGEYESWRVYEFLLPDHRTRQFVVVGLSE
ncbi:MAG TPA: hypothetical protein VJO35_10800 [Terriglobales bacterium]|nr:hypothetical protein [Terriglobales bacterium]